MRKAWLVAMREFSENARTKGFWIGLLIFPILLTAGIKVPALLESKATPTRYFAVVDPGGELADVVVSAVDARYESRRNEAETLWFLEQSGKPEAERTPFEEPRRKLVAVDLPEDIDTSSPASLRAGLREYLAGEGRVEVDGESKELFAVLVIPEGFDPLAEAGDESAAEFWCTNLADDDLRDIAEQALAEEFRGREYIATGVDLAEVERINAIDPELTAKDPTKEEGEEEVSKMDELRQWAPVLFVYLLFISIFQASGMLLNSTVEEKSNRVVEVLFSSVTAWELMIGKLLGIACIGVTMLAFWFGTGYGVVILLGGADPELIDMILGVLFAPEMIAPFVAYFLLGYLMYAAVFIAIGSMCNTIKESQNFMGPIMVVSMVPLMTMVFIPKDPNGALASFLSWVPPWTPFVMMNRAAASPPLFDVVGTLLLLIVSVAVAIWAAGRIFRTGILRTGQPPRLLELAKWIRGS